MKKLILFFGLYHVMGASDNCMLKKTCFVPLSDAYPLRYFYHTPFYYDQFDVGAQWLCKGNCTIRYQRMIDRNLMTNILFDTPMVVASQGVLESQGVMSKVYNGTVMGLGNSNMVSVIDTNVDRNSFFIDFTVDISRINLPYYFHIGVPVQRTVQKVDWCETITNNNGVIKGGFIQEYLPDAPVSLQEWQQAVSIPIPPLASVREYIDGKSIGVLYESRYGKVPCAPMTLWAIADIYLQLGYDGCIYKNLTAGWYLRFVIPTSPSLHSAWNKYMFYPTIGNVSRWQVDCGVNGNIKFFDNDVSGIKLFFDGYLGYLGSAWHLRPFDLRNGFFTRYGLVKMFDVDTLQSSNSAIRAIDVTTRRYNIGSAVKVELILDCEYQYLQSFFNLGYSLKLQGHEKINCDDVNPYATTYAGMKKFVYGFSPQQVFQTPDPRTISSANWTTQLITPRSNMTMVADEDISFYRDSSDQIVGVPFSESFQMDKEDIDFNSGLMNAQLLNILVLGYKYKIIGRQYDTIFGVLFSYGKSPMKYYTPSFYEFGLFLELDY